MTRKPDYWLKAMDSSVPGKSRKSTARVGAAWRNDDGSISIDLDAFVVLQANPHLVLTLFPIDRTGINASDDE